MADEKADNAAQPLTEEKSPVFDPAAVEQLRSMLGTDVVGELVGEFERAGVTSLKRMDQAVAAGDVRTCQREVHGLKSAAASLGLARLSHCCLVFEMECRAGHFADAPRQANQVHEMYRGALEAIHHLKIAS